MRRGRPAHRDRARLRSRRARALRTASQRRRSARDPRSATRGKHRLASLAEITARELFAPLGPTYDRYARLLSFGQDPRWRHFMVSRIPPQAKRVLDVATGTGAVALELVAAEPGRRVVGIDQSTEMLAVAGERVD